MPEFVLARFGMLRPFRTMAADRRNGGEFNLRQLPITDLISVPQATFMTVWVWQQTLGSGIDLKDEGQAGVGHLLRFQSCLD